MEDMSEMTSAVESADLGSNPIVAKLDSLSIPHTTYAHTLCTTADELVSNVPLTGEDEGHTKNLFLRDKKHGLFLVTAATDAAVNTKELGKMLGLQGKTNLRMADEAILLEKLGCKKGCVGPLSMMNNADGDVTLVVDESLLKLSKVHSHPLRNDASTSMVPSDLIRFLKEVGVEPTLLEFGKKGDEPAPAREDKGKPKIPPKPAGAKKSANKDKKTTKKGETQLALKWKKSENFAMW